MNHFVSKRHLSLALNGISKKRFYLTQVPCASLQLSNSSIFRNKYKEFVYKRRLQYVLQGSYNCTIADSRLLYWNRFSKKIGSKVFKNSNISIIARVSKHRYQYVMVLVVQINFVLMCFITSIYRCHEIH